MSSTIHSRTSLTNSLLPRYKFKHQDLHLHLQRNCRKCKIGPSHQRPPRRLGRNWQNTAWHCQRRSGNPFNLIRSHNGHVPWRMPCLHGHAHRPLVKRRLPTIHPKTSSHNVSKKMLKFQNCQHIPNFNHQIHTNDPQVRNDPNNSETRRNVSGDTSRQARLSSFAQFS